MNRKQFTMATLFVTVLLAVASTPMASQQGSTYDPWVDLNDDGKIDVEDLAYLARRYGTLGPPFAAKAAIEYDSGWIDISGKVGQYFNVTHNLNSTDIMVDITGKTTVNGGEHQRHLGLTGYAAGWSKTYGRAISDIARSVVQTCDEGYALGGQTGSFSTGLWDFWLVKTDSAGTMQWSKTYGGANADVAYSLVRTADGGYALAGYTASYGAGSYDFWLVKTDSAGTMQWDKTYGGAGEDLAWSVVQTVDGGYALAGRTLSYGAGYSDFWLVKADSAGTMQWSKTYGGANADVAYSLVQTVDGGYALAGHTFSYGAGGADFWLVKTDSAGTMQWDKTYGGTSEDVAYSLVRTADGGYALAGYTASYGAGSYDFWLVKTDSAGTMQWDKTYGGAGEDLAWSVVQTVDGGYALAGYTGGGGARNADFWLVKTDVGAGLAWTDSTLNHITLYRGATDIHWNYVRVRVWEIK